MIEMLSYAGLILSAFKTGIFCKGKRRESKVRTRMCWNVACIGISKSSQQSFCYLSLAMGCNIYNTTMFHSMHKMKLFLPRNYTENKE